MEKDLCGGVKVVVCTELLCRYVKNELALIETVTCANNIVCRRKQKPKTPDTGQRQKKDAKTTSTRQH